MLSVIPRYKANIAFVAREYVIANDFLCVRIDEEAIFSSFDKAKKFIDSLSRKKTLEEEYTYFRFEIIEYKIDNSINFINKWTFDIHGNLIDDSSKSNNYLDKSVNKNILEVGDIIYIIKNIENINSPSISGSFGVIAEYDNIENLYMIYYINSETGLVDHFHVIQDVIIKIKEVPNEFIFLYFLSYIIKNKSDINSKLLFSIVNENVFVKNIKKFDFQNCIICESANVKESVLLQNIITTL